MTQVIYCKRRGSQTQLIAVLLAMDHVNSLRRADAVFGFCFTRRKKSVAKNCPRLISLFLRQTLPRRNLRSERRVGAHASICLPDFNTCRTFQSKFRL